MSDLQSKLQERRKQADRTACQTCAGTGEIIRDWERYLEPRARDTGNEAVSDCPDCQGKGE